ncbi:MAG: hypothetical protein CMIDDMOC_00117 [Sodalis sp. Fle]|nr:MAG: hypothetical protein CMIDDMOC_00117 [Sodalis sp. Fle]
MNIIISHVKLTVNFRITQDQQDNSNYVEKQRFVFPAALGLKQQVLYLVALECAYGDDFLFLVGIQ